MKGIVLVSGVNYAGKGTAIRIIKNNLGDNVMDTPSVSKLMMDKLGISTHDELGRIDPNHRSRIRWLVLSELAESSGRKPIFLDTHFVFENGEKSDFTPLIRKTKLVLLVQPDPEIIVSRATADQTNHPGRVAVRDMSLVTNYIASDHEAAISYLDTVQCVTGFKPELLTIRNNTNDLQMLQNEVNLAMPKIYRCLEMGIGGEGDFIGRRL